MQPALIDFRKPENLTELSQYIGIKEDYFLKLIDPRMRRIFFHRHEIPKRNVKNVDEFRLVWEPHMFVDEQKSFARRFDFFARHAEPRYPDQSVYGYIKGRNTFDNGV